jgi:hypothetical protein
MHALRLSPPATTPGIFPRPYACALYMPYIRAGHLGKRYGLREHPGAVLVGLAKDGV